MGAQVLCTCTIGRNCLLCSKRSSADWLRAAPRAPWCFDILILRDLVSVQASLNTWSDLLRVIATLWPRDHLSRVGLYFLLKRAVVCALGLEEYFLLLLRAIALVFCFTQECFGHCYVLFHYFGRAAPVQIPGASMHVTFVRSVTS